MGIKTNAKVNKTKEKKEAITELNKAEEEIKNCEEKIEMLKFQADKKNLEYIQAKDRYKQVELRCKLAEQRCKEAEQRSREAEQRSREAEDQSWEIQNKCRSFIESQSFSEEQVKKLELKLLWVNLGKAKNKGLLRSIDGDDNLEFDDDLDELLEEDEADGEEIKEQAPDLGSLLKSQQSVDEA